MTLYFLQYNNYYNRIIKREETLEAYLDYEIGSSLTGVNFKPGDGVTTEQKINWPIGLNRPNYIVVVDENNGIDSRWFVLEEVRVRGGQYNLILRRDLIVDFYDNIVQSPVFIEKAKLHIQDDLIFNSENMTYNQILKRKAELKDETEVPWIVGYIPRDYAESPTTINIDAYGSEIDPVGDIETVRLETWEYAQYINSEIKAPPELLLLNYNAAGSRIGGSYNINARMNNLRYEITNYTNAAGNTAYPLQVNLVETPPIVNSNTLEEVTEWFFNSFRAKNNWDNILSNILISDTTISTETNIRNLLALDGKTLKVTETNAIYDISVKENVSGYTKNLIPINSNLSIFLQSNFEAKTKEVYEWKEYEYTNTTFGYRGKTYNVILRQRGKEAKVTISNSRYHLEDAPYDMFCIPAGNITIYKDGVSYLNCQGSLAAATATAIGLAAGTGVVYDIQMLPYCPVRYMLTYRGLDIRGHYADLVTDNTDQPLTMVLWATKSTDNFTIGGTHAQTMPTDAIEFKLASETEFCRIVSPNGNGAFEFTPAKNDGVRYYNIDFTYRPFEPFIHVRPHFNRLYGENPTKDFRGLVCGGSFSIPQLNSAWATYQMQNVNYQNIFDRNVQNMEINNNLLRGQQITGGIIGAVNTAIQGGTSAAMIGIAGGGSPGTAAGLGAAGALVGGAASALGLAQDVYYADKQREEALAYTKDMYGYTLGNIQAIPATLAKTGAMVYNNTLFPTVEFYGCSAVERTALRNKLKYNGMTVMAIGKIYQHIWPNEKTFIRGTLIRTETINEEPHIVNAIASELSKGVFI